MIHSISVVAIRRIRKSGLVDEIKPLITLKRMGLAVKSLRNLLAGIIHTIPRLQINGLLIKYLMVHCLIHQFQSPNHVIGSERHSPKNLKWKHFVISNNILIQFVTLDK